MSIPVILALASSLSIACIGWRITCGIARGSVRGATRILIAVAIVFGAWPCLLYAWSAPLDHGRWRCTICDKGIEQSRYFGVPIEGRKEHESSTEALEAREFERWFEATFDQWHDHDWMAVGCHTIGTGTVECAMYPARSYYCALPKLPDQELARAMVRRLMSWDPATRRAQLRSFGEIMATGAFTRDQLDTQKLLAEGDPWRSVCDGTTLDDAEFKRLHTEWLELHPAWK